MIFLHLSRLSDLCEEWSLGFSTKLNRLIRKVLSVTNFVVASCNVKQFGACEIKCRSDNTNYITTIVRYFSMQRKLTTFFKNPSWYLDNVWNSALNFLLLSAMETIRSQYLTAPNQPRHIQVHHPRSHKDRNTMWQWQIKIRNAFSAHNGKKKKKGSEHCQVWGGLL